MNWTLKSPGIWTGELQGFVITRIAEKQVPGRMNQQGERPKVPVYKYIAARPGTKELPYTRFASDNFERIKQDILHSQVKTLF